MLNSGQEYRTVLQMEALFVSVNILILVFLGSLCHALEDCDTAKQRRCRQNLVEELDKRSGAQSTRELEYHCRHLRENMNCLVLQVTQCPTPNRSGDLISRAWQYMQDNCDTFGGWWNFECFNLEQVKKCEKIFALHDEHTTCREFDKFRHCISDIVMKQCDDEDVFSMGNYLLDSAGDMIWTCPHQSSPAKSPIVDTGFVGVTKKEKNIASDQRVPPLAVAPLPLDATKKSAAGNRIEVEESHLRGVYTASLTADSPYVTGCNARATEEMRGCLDRHQYERDQALGARDEEDRLRKECCATWNYRHCLQNAVRIHCYDRREVDIQSAMDVIPHDRGFLCRNHWIYTCSGAKQVAGEISLLLFAITVALSVFSSRSPKILS